MDKQYMKYLIDTHLSAEKRGRCKVECSYKGFFGRKWITGTFRGYSIKSGYPSYEVTAIKIDHKTIFVDAIQDIWIYRKVEIKDKWEWDEWKEQQKKRKKRKVGRQKWIKK